MLAPAVFSQALAKRLTIEDIYSGTGIASGSPDTIKWSPDGSKVSFLLRDPESSHRELVYLDAATGAQRTLISDNKLSQLAPSPTRIQDERERERVTRYHVAAYIWAPDSKHMLFDSQGQLWYYSFDTGTAVQLTSSPEPASDPKFSPDGKRLAYVRGHTLYVHPVSGEEGERLLIQTEKKEKEKDFTKDDTILNGEVDWVYAEELAVRSNFFWSPEGHEILFLQMDETRVPTYPITDWNPTHAHVELQRYPQPGDPNPAVRLGVVSGEGSKPRWIKLTDDDDMYVPRFGWIREGWAWAEVLNRKQNRLDLYFIEIKSGRARKVLSESEPDAWVNVNDDFRILNSGDRFLWTSWRDGHTHIFLYSFDRNDPAASDAKLDRQLESGDYEVLAISGIDAKSNTIFFTANKDDPREEKIFSVKLGGASVEPLAVDPGTNTVTFSDDGGHYILTHTETLVGPKISLCATGGSCQKIWQAPNLAAYDLIPPKLLEFKAEDGATLYGALTLPRNIDASAKIPLIVYIYGGPAGQTVQNSWGSESGSSRALFHQLLVKEGYAIFSVDNRGTPNRGKKFSMAIRNQFGGIELKDQIAALDQLLAQYPQLDRNRVGIWGWSGGGSMTLYALTRSDRFKAGISGAPVTNWRLYDSIYTERYLGLPKDNPTPYDNTIVSAASSLHGSLLLIHGTSDDNVHFQNTIQMTDTLIRAGKQFLLMAYPNKTHGITGTDEQRQLYHMMENFWNQELK